MVVLLVEYPQDPCQTVLFRDELLDASVDGVAVDDELALHRLDLGCSCPITFGPLVTESCQLVGHLRSGPPNEVFGFRERGRRRRLDDPQQGGRVYVRIRVRGRVFVWQQRHRPMLAVTATAASAQYSQVGVLTAGEAGGHRAGEVRDGAGPTVEPWPWCGVVHRGDLNLGAALAVALRLVAERQVAPLEQAALLVGGQAVPAGKVPPASQGSSCSSAASHSCHGSSGAGSHGP